MVIHLFDSFCIVTFKPELPKPPPTSSLQRAPSPQPRTNSACEKPPPIKFAPKVIYEFRAYRWPIPATIGYFCFPENRVYPSPGYCPNDLFSFVLTTQSNDRRHCFALRFTLQDDRPPECLCLMSSFYWPNIMADLLSMIQLRYIRSSLFQNQSSKIPSQADYDQLFLPLLEAIVHPNPFPRPGFAFDLSIPSPNLKDGQSLQLSLIRPDETLGFSSQRDMRILLSCFTSAQIVELHLWMLLERGVLILGDDLNEISTVCECLCSLLYPFEWKQVFVSVLPAGMVDYIAAPMPFIMGTLHSNVAKFASSIGDVCICDLRDKRILYPQLAIEEHEKKKTNLVPSPSPSSFWSSRSSSRHTSSEKKLSPPIQMLGSSFVLTPLFSATSFAAASKLTSSLTSLILSELSHPNSVEVSVFLGPTFSSTYFSVRVLHLFFSFHASLLNSYKNTIRPSGIDFPLLVSLAPPCTRPFLSLFVETRMCVEFGDVLIRNQQSKWRGLPTLQIQAPKADGKGEKKDLEKGTETDKDDKVNKYMPTFTRPQPLLTRRTSIISILPPPTTANPLTSTSSTLPTNTDRPHDPFNTHSHQNLPRLNRTFSMVLRKDQSDAEVWMVTLIDQEIDAERELEERERQRRAKKENKVKEKKENKVKEKKEKKEHRWSRSKREKEPEPPSPPLVCEGSWHRFEEVVENERLGRREKTRKISSSFQRFSTIQPTPTTPGSAERKMTLRSTARPSPLHQNIITPPSSPPLTDVPSPVSSPDINSESDESDSLSLGHPETPFDEIPFTEDGLHPDLTEGFRPTSEAS